MIDLTSQQARDLYNIVRDQCQQEYDNMINFDDLDVTHLSWSRISETNLHTWSILEQPDGILHSSSFAAAVIAKSRSTDTGCNADSRMTHNIPSLTRGLIADTITLMCVVRKACPYLRRMSALMLSHNSTDNAGNFILWQKG